MEWALRVRLEDVQGVRGKDTAVYRFSVTDVAIVIWRTSRGRALKKKKGRVKKLRKEDCRNTCHGRSLKQRQQTTQQDNIVVDGQNGLGGNNEGVSTTVGTDKRVQYEAAMH